MARLKSIIGILVVAVGIYMVWKIAPAYYNNYQFQSYIDDQAKLESYSARTEPDIAAAVAKQANDYDISLTAEQIRVQKTNDGVTIATQYTIHIDIPIHPFDITFTPESKNKRI